MTKSYRRHLLQYDGDGRTVLSLALESGHSDIRRDIEKEENGCIREIVKLDPRVLGLRDLKTRLYPFMTAACNEERIVEMHILDDLWAVEGTESGQRRIEEIRLEAPLTCLNNIYSLLRADPSSISTRNLAL